MHKAMAVRICSCSESCSDMVKMLKIETPFEWTRCQTFFLSKRPRTFVKAVTRQRSCSLEQTINTMVECVDRDDANEFFCAIATAVINRVLTQSDHILFWAALKHNLRTRGSFFLVGGQSKDAHKSPRDFFQCHSLADAFHTCG